MSKAGMFLVGVLAPTWLWAHPDHAADSSAAPLLHFISDPYHLGIAALALLAGWGARRCLMGAKAAKSRD